MRDTIHNTKQINRKEVDSNTKDEEGKKLNTIENCKKEINNI